MNCCLFDIYVVLVVVAGIHMVESRMDMTMTIHPGGIHMAMTIHQQVMTEVKAANLSNQLINYCFNVDNI